LTIVTFTYFYRRRAMLGAKCRWEMAERWWPALAGPAAYTHRKPGFLRLPLWSRVLLILAVLALNVVRAWPG
jgi:hypothetical protein